LDIVESELDSGTPPEKIGFISFTKKAANEAKDRALRRFTQFSEDQFEWMRTLHSLCLQCSQLSRDRVINRRRLVEFADDIRVPIGGEWDEETGTYSGREIGDLAIQVDNLARVKCMSLRDQYNIEDHNASWREVDYVSQELIQYKATEQVYDFTDMLSTFAERGQSPDLEVLALDEAQDFSQLQWRAIKRLIAGAFRLRRVVVAGDDDQAIYEWSGADVDHFVGLQGDVRVLAQSYRVPALIHQLGESIILPVKHRRAKNWLPRTEQGVIERVPGIEYLPFDGPDILLMARNKYILNDVTQYLRDIGVYYEHMGHLSVPKNVARAVRAWGALRLGQSVELDEVKCAYKYIRESERGVRRGFKDLADFPADAFVTMQDLRERGGLVADGKWFEALDRLPDVAYLRKLVDNGENLRERPRVRVSTIHAAKGGEASHVILMTDMAATSYREMLVNPDAERRVQYVGVTRARERLTIVGAQGKYLCPWL
jgi:DNA helicase-2/ATP-dependent DNA helicase PcrA